MGISDPNVMFKGPGPLLSNNFIETKSYYSTLSQQVPPPLKNDNFSLSLRQTEYCFAFDCIFSDFIPLYAL